MSRIHRLDPLLVNQIAAGEVIERPASVLKELMENAIDSGASKITVRLQQGGKQLIEITDNGDGILVDDLELAVTTHATSKICDLEDLMQIASLGFRGEALASIASVSKFEIISKPLEQAQAYRLAVEGKASQVLQCPDVHPKGTTIKVKELFFNVPARQKFLKQDKTEYLYCEEVFKRMALSHAQISLELIVDNKSKYFYPAIHSEHGFKDRIKKVLGKKIIDHAREVDFFEHEIHCYGIVATEDYARSQTDQQFVFLNGRFIKDKLIQHAIRQAYEDRIYAGRYPSFVLFIQLDPSQVDINVHPQKTEVRFKEPRLIHDLFISRIKHALGSAQQEHIVQTEVPRVPYSAQQSLTPRKRVVQAELQHLSNQAQQNFDAHTVFVHDQEMLVIDLERFYQCVISHQLAKQSSFEKESLLFPARATIHETQWAVLEQESDLLEQMGMMLDRLSQNTILLRTKPTIQGFELDEQQLLTQIIQQKNLNEDLIKKILSKTLRITEQLKKKITILNYMTQFQDLPVIRINLARFEVMS